jgi:hypothetical protein
MIGQPFSISAAQTPSVQSRRALATWTPIRVKKVSEYPGNFMSQFRFDKYLYFVYYQ